MPVISGKRSLGRLEQYVVSHAMSASCVCSGSAAPRLALAASSAATAVT